MKKKQLFLVTLVAMLLLAACGKKENNKVTSADQDQKLVVYTTVYPLQYFTERIGGADVEVQSIYPSGADEHSFDPTQKDMMALADADLFFYIGLGLEGFVEKAEKTLKGEHVNMVATADVIPEDLLEEGHSDVEHDEHEGHEEHEHGPLDPHVWISPLLSIKLANTIKEALIEAAPNSKEEFETNFEELKADLQDLDASFKEMADAAPSKTFFVSHAAFGYIAHTYGLEQVAIAGLNSQSEPSQKQLAEIVALAKEKDVKYILFEQNISSKLTDVVRKEIGAEALMLHNLGVRTPDDVKNEENYFTLMNQNIDTLKKALGSE